MPRCTIRRTPANGMAAVLWITRLSLIRKDGRWNIERGKYIFRFYTCQSNVLCALTCLLMCVFTLAGEVPEWVWLLKYIGTAAVTVTMMTVLLFLGPMVGSVTKLLTKSDFFLHLLNPLAALVSLCVFERRPLSFPAALLGMIPVALYAPLYAYKVLHAPEEKRWDDFYRFNMKGKLPLAYLLMAAGTFLICMALMWILNL